VVASDREELDAMERSMFNGPQARPCETWKSRVTLSAVSRR